MRIISAYLLIVLIQMPLLIRIGVAGHWQLNREQITRESCINKNNPAAHCNGKCQFRKWMQTIAQQESQDQKPFPHEQLSKVVFAPFIIAKTHLLTLESAHAFILTNFQIPQFKLLNFSLQLWQPPD